MHADFLTRGGVVGPLEGEGEFGRHRGKDLEMNRLPAGMGNSA